MPTETHVLTEVSESDATQYPSLITRIQSVFVDSLIVILLIFLAGKILDQFESVPDWVRIVLFIGAWSIYEPIAQVFGCTLGNYLLGIRVRQYKNQQKRINLLQAYIRFVVKIALGWFSFLAIHFNDAKRALHDLASGSIMIKLAKKEAS